MVTVMVLILVLLAVAFSPQNLKRDVVIDISFSSSLSLKVLRGKYFRRKPFLKAAKLKLVSVLASLIVVLRAKWGSGQVSKSNVVRGVV